jgi:hypothetical protein
MTLSFHTVGQNSTSGSFIANENLNEVKLSEDQLADFTEMAKQKTNALSDYISIIGDKSKEEAQRIKAIDLAVKLFVSENNIIQVSSLNSSEKKTYKIRTYLNKLKVLPYTKVTIKWYKIFYASNFVKRPDGKYEAIATIYQEFKGETGDGSIYYDVTQKNIQIIIDQIEIKTGDQVEKRWEVLLGDIFVMETENDKSKLPYK